jgi:DNA-binding NarL/FixJ family response regulator
MQGLASSSRWDVPVRILIAFESEPVRHALRSLIASNSDWELCGEARVGRSAYELALKTKPDVVVVDTVAPAMGISLSRLLRDDLPDAQCLLLTIHEAADTVMSAVAAGVKGYVLKREGDHDLANAIRKLAAGRSFYSPAILDVIVDAASTARGKHLKAFSARELSVTTLLAEGRTNGETAKLLGISIRTVESHRHGAMRKAGVHTASELVAFAMRHKMIA